MRRPFGTSSLLRLDFLAGMLQPWQHGSWLLCIFSVFLFFKADFDFSGLPVDNSGFKNNGDPAFPGFFHVIHHCHIMLKPVLKFFPGCIFLLDCIIRFHFKLKAPNIPTSRGTNLIICLRRTGNRHTNELFSLSVNMRFGCVYYYSRLIH